MAPSNFGRKMLSYKGLTLMTAPLAVLVAAGTVMGASAALNVSSDNSGNSWKTASTELTLDNSNTATAMFNAVDIPAGYTETHCITLTNSSPIPATIKAFGTGLAYSALSDELALTVEKGTAGTDDGLPGDGDHCTGFVADATPSVFAGTLTDYAETAGAENSYGSGFGAKTLAVDESVTYRVTTSLPGDADVAGALNGLSTGVDFTFEIAE